ncbi:MAG: ECF transporter S component [Candidatus Hodarchaeales archaeon]
MKALTTTSSKEINLITEVALTAAFTTLTFLSTSLFQFSLVSTSGYFNLGEVFVYLSALVGGPFVGAISGGLGSAMADVFLGAGSFAPATLVLKGLEGFTVGLLFQMFKKSSEKTHRSRLSLITVIFLAWITPFIIIFSVLATAPSMNLIEGNIVLFNALISVPIPSLVFVFVALALSGLIWYIEFKMEDKGKMMLPCLLAGPIIVVGYFVWEVVVLSLAPEVALFEIPFNIAQVIFGTLIAVPVMNYLDELGILDVIQQHRSIKE